MAGKYEINFSKMNATMTNFEQTLTKIQKEIQQLESIRTTTLSDTVWKGNQKTKFANVMVKYQNALNELYKSANEHYQKCQEIIGKYSSQEQV